MSATRVSSRVRTNRRYSLLGTCVLLTITVIQLPKAVDLLHELRSHKSHHAGLLSGSLVPQRSEKLDSQLDDLDKQLSRFERSMIGIDRITAVQSQLMEFAQESECRLRKSVSQSGTTEVWTPADVDPDDENAAYDIDESPYKLRTEQLSLRLEGTMGQTLDFLDKVRKSDWLAKPSQISFARSPEEAEQLVVEVNLSFYELTKSNIVNEELIQWRDDPQSEAVH